eukprot:4682377-Prymnesium_polylepis.1
MSSSAANSSSSGAATTTGTPTAPAAGAEMRMPRIQIQRGRWARRRERERLATRTHSGAARGGAARVTAARITASERAHGLDARERCGGVRAASRRRPTWRRMCCSTRRTESCASRWGRSLAQSRSRWRRTRRRHSGCT